MISGAIIYKASDLKKKWILICMIFDESHRPSKKLKI